MQIQYDWGHCVHENLFTLYTYHNLIWDACNEFTLVELSFLLFVILRILENIGYFSWTITYKR